MASKRSNIEAEVQHIKAHLGSMPGASCTTTRKGSPLPRVGKVDGNYRNPRLLRLAAKAPHCMICGGGSEGEMVGCHSNYLRHGHGTGIKSHDLVLYACGTCHDLLDGRRKGWDSMQKELAWSDGLFNTFLWLLQSGHLEVKP